MQVFKSAAKAVLLVLLAYLSVPQRVALRADCTTPKCGSGFEFQRDVQREEGKPGKQFLLSTGQVLNVTRVEAVVNLKTDRARAVLVVGSEGDKGEHAFSQSVNLLHHPTDPDGKTDQRQIDTTLDINATEVGEPGKRICYHEREGPGLPIVCPDSGITLRGTLSPPLYRLLVAIHELVSG